MGVRVPLPALMIPEDAPTWDEPRIRQEIQALLPQGWQFAFGRRRLAYHGFYRDGDGQVIWEFESPASNLALFEAYAYLALRDRRPSSRRNNWSPRRELTLERVRSDALRTQPDPPDLDPSEVEAVYRGRTNR